MSDYRQMRELKGALGWDVCAGLTMAAIFALSVPLAAAQWLALRLVPVWWWTIPGFWHRTMCRILGVEVQVRGTMAVGRPVLFASNHISWLDILVLGGLIKGSFVAKKEVAGWGVFGTLARLHRTVFIDRERRSASAGQRDELRARFAGGESLILFPEGTSTDGTWVKPFKSALFSVAEPRLKADGDGPDGPRLDGPGLDGDAPDGDGAAACAPANGRAAGCDAGSVLVQPVTLTYVRVNGMPFVRSQRPRVAWFGDMELTSHVWQLLSIGKLTVLVQFHPPMDTAQVPSRKQLAAACHSVVSDGLMAANAGRLPAPETRSDRSA